MAEFERQLEALIGRPTELRPFVCEGSPLECSVFIVGENPATPLSNDWWHYWAPGYGFRKSEWMQDYIAEREERPLKPGKKRRQKVSSTRRTINWIVAAAAPAKCLETNVVIEEAETPKYLQGRDAGLAVLDFLLRQIRPLVVIAHGDTAIEHIGAINGCNIRWGQEAEAACDGHAFRLIAAAHFGRPRGGQGWSQARSEELGIHAGRVATGAIS